MVVEQNLTVIASSLTNRLIDNYKPISRHVGKERMPMLKDLRDSNTLEHFAKSIGYVYHRWETDGSKLKLPKFCLLKSSYSYNLNDCVVLDYDEETGYYSEIESSIPNYNLFRTEISDLVQC